MPFILGFGRFERLRDDRRPAPSTARVVAAAVLVCAALGYLAASGVADDRGLRGLVVSLPFLGVVLGGIAGAQIQRNTRSLATTPGGQGP